MTFDKYIADFGTHSQCYRLWHMTRPTSQKKPTKNIETTVSLYVLAEVIVGYIL